MWIHTSECVEMGRRKQMHTLMLPLSTHLLFFDACTPYFALITPSISIESSILCCLSDALCYEEHSGQLVNNLVLS
jgi:hypothetical protein